MNEFERRYDRYRDKVADYTTDELWTEHDRLIEIGDRRGILGVREASYLDAVIDELEERDEIA